jgi:hypothetical protein
MRLISTLALKWHWRTRTPSINEQSNIYPYEYLSAITLHGPGYLLAGIYRVRLYT